MNQTTLTANAQLVDLLDKYVNDSGKSGIETFWMITSVPLAIMSIIGFVGAVLLVTYLETRPARYAWYTALTAILVIAPVWNVFSSFHAHNEASKDSKDLSNEVSSAIRAELRDKYEIQDAEAQYGEHTKEEWIDLVMDSSFEPAEVLVRTEAGTTVEYELRLDGDELNLYQLDATAPSPETILR